MNRKSGWEKGKNEPQRPQKLGEIIARVFIERGWGRKQHQLQLESVWNEIVGPEIAGHSRVGTLRRGVLEITVDSAVLMQELNQFHKRRVLEQLRSRFPKKVFLDLRFRAGVLE